MRFVLENLGSVARADIRLEGLTVLAGGNGSGKSTVCKWLFSLVKAWAHAGGSSVALAAELGHLLDASFGQRLGGAASSAYLEGAGAPDRLGVWLKAGQLDRVCASETFGWRDATYINEPLFLGLLGGWRRTDMPYPMRDLADKLHADRFAQGQGNRLSAPLTSLMGGRFRFDDPDGRLVFDQGGTVCPPVQVGAGCQALGLLQLLLDVRAIDKERLLIWEEPEGHLHPEGQVQLAEVLVRLAKAGIPILISSHSPYLVQGARYHAARYGMEAFVSYYLSEAGSDGAHLFREVTDTLNDLFVQWAAPLNGVMQVDWARQHGA